MECRSSGLLRGPHFPPVPPLVFRPTYLFLPKAVRVSRNFIGIDSSRKLPCDADCTGFAVWASFRFSPCLLMPPPCRQERASCFSLETPFFLLFRSIGPCPSPVGTFLQKEGDPPTHPARCFSGRNLAISSAPPEFSPPDRDVSFPKPLVDEYLRKTCMPPSCFGDRASTR